MNRTLRRPMFRIGGVAEGITSGLQPRQGYATNKENLVKENDYSKMNFGDFFKNASMEDIEKFIEAKRYKPKSDPWDYLGEVALNLVSNPSSGNIVGDIGTSMREPYSRYLDRKQTAAEQAYGSKSDLFGTMIGAQAKILAAESGEGMAGKTEQWKMEQIPIYINTISEIENLKNSDEWNTLTKEEQTEKQNELDTARTSLGRLEKEDPFVGWFLQSDQSDKLFKKVKTELLETDQQSDEPKYTGEDDPQLWEDTYIEFRKRVKRMGKAEGGRIGYANAGAVMPGAMPTGQAAMPTDQGLAPEDMGPITYEELRARLPQEVGDDIVRLLVNSAEALEDFAMIQTEQDINNFNKKYGVNLVLPAEG